MVRNPGPSSASLSPSNRAAISSGVNTWLISALRLSQPALPQDQFPWGAAPARPFDSPPGALIFSTTPDSPLNSTFILLISNDCASFETRYVNLLKQAENRQMPVHFLKQDPRRDSINLLELLHDFLLHGFRGPGDAGQSEPEKRLGGGGQAPVRGTESVRFLTQGGFSLPKVGTYAKRILS